MFQGFRCNQWISGYRISGPRPRSSLRLVIVYIPISNLRRENGVERQSPWMQIQAKNKPSDDSRWVPRLHFSQSVPPLLRFTWTVYQRATKTCSSVIGQYYSDYKQTRMETRTLLILISCPLSTILHSYANICLQRLVSYTVAVKSKILPEEI